MSNANIYWRFYISISINAFLVENMLSIIPKYSSFDMVMNLNIVICWLYDTHCICAVGSVVVWGLQVTEICLPCEQAGALNTHYHHHTTLAPCSRILQVWEFQWSSRISAAKKTWLVAGVNHKIFLKILHSNFSSALSILFSIRDFSKYEKHKNCDTLLTAKFCHHNSTSYNAFEAKTVHDCILRCIDS